MTEGSRSLDVCETGLRRWVDQLKTERGGITPVSKALTPDQQHTQELEARVNRLEREEIILKKAWYGIPAALLMSVEWNRKN
ncbi:hypothetical protein [Reinekea forsetii]|uniref:hypothetical protein n=1 Tax=Reinekea forsetii TaxID=1336806 RepID=UPI000C22CC7A|nr:hypothetical protein [Reinekea forsetii]